jgi:hypothetical protein
MPRRRELRAAGPADAATSARDDRDAPGEETRAI